MMTGGGGGGLTVTGPPDPGPGSGGKKADAVWVVRVNAAAPIAALGIILISRAGMFMASPSAVLRGGGDFLHFIGLPARASSPRLSGPPGRVDSQARRPGPNNPHERRDPADRSASLERGRSEPSREFSPF
jgi:hypothetical protein